MTGTSSADRFQGLPQAIVTLRKTYPDGYHSRRHSHPRVQIMHAVSGLMLADTDGASWAVPPGYGLVIPAATPHRTRMIGEVRLQSLYVTRTDFEAVQRPDCRIVAFTPLMTALVERLCELENSGNGTALAHHLSRLILLDLAEARDSPLALPFPRRADLLSVCETLLRDPADPRTIDHWAYACGMSRRTFTRAFRLHTGLSFDRWRQRLRCQAAHRLLARGESIHRVAPKVGYGSAYALEAMMRKLR